MAIRGSLREANLADVIQLLALGRKTGCLSVSDRRRFGQIYFDRGMIVQASLVNRRDRLGDLLVKRGSVPRSVVDAALEEQTGHGDRRLGDLLLERGALSQETLEQFIRLQVEQAVYQLFTWTRGSFHFEPDERPAARELLVTIVPENVLLEAARRVDEWALIEKAIPSPGTVFRVDRSHGDPSQAELTVDERRVLPLIDGRRSVAEVVEGAGLPEFEAYRSIYQLVQAGYARPHGKKEMEPAEASSPLRLREHHNLGVAFLRARMFDDAEREFHRILELDPGNTDARFALAVLALRQGRVRRATRGFMALIECGGGSAASFHNLALALEASGRVEHALLVVEEALEIDATDPSLLLAQAILLTRSGRLEGACRAFDGYARASAGQGTPPASYFVYSVLALAGTGRTAEAHVRVDEGLDAYPRSPQLLVNAAAVLERSGAMDQAEGLYRRALDEAPDLPQALRGLADALYRRAAYDEARPLYARLTGRNGSGGADLHFRLGEIAYRSGDREEAIRRWRATLAADPDHATARTNLELVHASPDDEGS